MSEPTERFVLANGLRHHVLEWTPASREGAETVLLAHGFLDLAWSYRWLAEELVQHGYRVLAWDWRGHGETERVGRGGYYHFYDYSLDLEELLAELVPVDEKAHLIAHSMGGSVAVIYAGTRPERIQSVCLIEGIGPGEWNQGHVAKMKIWLDSVARIRSRELKPMSVEDASQRLRRTNPDLPKEKADFLAEKGTLPIEGGVAWRFDPLHRSTSPAPFSMAGFGEFMNAIAAPVLLVQGARGFRLPEEAERRALLGDHEFVELSDVGHMIHQLRPKELARIWRTFVTGLTTSSS